MSDEHESTDAPAGGEGADSGAAQTADVPAPETVAQAWLNFNGTLNAPGSVFGVAALAPDAPRTATGRPRPEEIAQVLARFVTPPFFDMANSALMIDHFAILSGEMGTGRRSGAIALLRGVTDRPLVVLNPIMTLAELASYKYKKFGYLITDWINGEGSSADTDFTLRMVRDQVRDAGAYLVITTSSGGPRRGADGNGIRQIKWSRPPLLPVLRAHLPDASDETLEELVGRVPATWTMTTLTRVTERIAAGDGPEAADEEFDLDSADAVRKWFADNNGSRRKILCVTALSFVSGARRREFEMWLERLEGHMNSYWPAASATGDGAEHAQSPPPSRTELLDEPGGLVHIDRVNVGPTSRHVVAFKAPTYRRHVLSELSRHHPMRFWSMVRSWLQEILGKCDQAQVAAGITLLAEWDHEEVDASFLEPWAGGEAGFPGQLTAIFTIWLMSVDDGLAPLALRTVMQWSNGRDLVRRWAAVTAFSGELGLRYPVKAVGQIWHVMAQREELGEHAQLALVSLFTALVEGNGIARIVLATLDSKLGEFGRPGADDRMRRMRDLTLDSIIQVVSARGVSSGKPVAATYLNRYRDEERTVVLARVWAGVLCDSRYRRRALEAMRSTLESLKEISPEEYEDLVYRFARQLRRAMPPGQRKTLRRALEHSKGAIDIMIKAFEEEPDEESGE